ncbi:MAG: hypothetical protein H0X02_04610 [Nitrosomonas sp.]|nr:hypothetical protein [Nitrosomonas sp.]
MAAQAPLNWRNGCSDIFKFTTTGHVDTIADYKVVNDTIQLENAVFTALTAPVL